MYFQKIQHAQAAAVAGGAVGRQSVVDPAAIISQHLGGMLSHKQGAEIFQVRHHLLRASQLHLQVLRRFMVGDLHRFRQPIDQHDHPVLPDRGRSGLAVFQRRQLPLHFPLHLPGKFRGGGHQDRRGVGVMLGLGEQVCG